jgi:hypothetical protein
MNIKRALLICGHHPPILARLKPYYKNSKYIQYSKIPVPDIENEILGDEIPLLPLKVPVKSQHE